MADILNKAKDTRLTYKGEKIKQVTFKPAVGSYNKQQAYQRADALRINLQKHHPGKYAISVAVRDKSISGWRSGKFESTAVPEIYIWSPELYDKEFNNVSAYGDPDQIPELIAESMVVYIKKIK